MKTQTARYGRFFSSIAALFAAIMMLFALNVPVVAYAGDPGRVTTSFDVKYASAVLHQVARLFSAGFDRNAADQVSRDIDALKADQPKNWQFSVQYQGRPQHLEIRALLDDLGMIDLDFATSPELAPAVRGAVDSYLNGHGH
jgi:hypothetical protein